MSTYWLMDEDVDRHEFDGDDQKIACPECLGIKFTKFPPEPDLGIRYSYFECQKCDWTGYADQMVDEDSEPECPEDCSETEVTEDGDTKACVDCGRITHYVDGDSEGFHWVRSGETLH